MSSDSALDHRLHAITRFLCSPLVTSLFCLHPNDLGRVSFRPPEEWQDWWNWAGTSSAGEDEGSWMHLLKYYDACRVGRNSSTHSFSHLPAPLRSMIEEAAILALPRRRGLTHHPSCTESPSSAVQATRPPDCQSTVLPGMSPKKAHEVVRMSEFIHELLRSTPALREVEHAIDIGAGQVRRYPPVQPFEAYSIFTPAWLSDIARRRICLECFATDYICMSLPSTGVKFRLRGLPVRKT